IEPFLVEEVAKYPDPQFVARVTTSHTLRSYDMKGLKILVTAGATRSWIDDVRFISNPSSGRMGIELAIEAYSRGAHVDLLHGHTDIQVPHTVNSFYCETTDKMAEKINELTKSTNYDIIIGAAAPVDFNVENKSEGKLRSENNYDIRLISAKKVLKSIANRPRILISFAAESIKSDSELYDNAKEKLRKYNADIVVANPANISDIGFSSLYDKVSIIFKDGSIINVEKTLKENLARIILDRAVSLIKGGV
ncbi:MAG: phosphopantothenoylcysteine decarboxylase, partial [Caldisphaera sp.]|nr:phosphopantothenoylcysteine decarboxylase [Caldisphaera sp.]